MARKTIDASAMFRSMTGHDEAESATSAAQTAQEALDTAPQTEVHPVKKTITPACPTQTRRASKRRETKSLMDKQTVKQGFYLTPRVYEALLLHKASNMLSARSDSAIVNAALSQYLASEINALNGLDETMDQNTRLRTALAAVAKEPAT